MKNIRTKIIQLLLSNETIQKGLETQYGIAQYAINNGYEKLSNKQKHCLKKYFHPVCEGDGIDKCKEKLSDEDHLHSLNEFPFYQFISCKNCLDQIEYRSKFN